MSWSLGNPSATAESVVCPSEREEDDEAPRSSQNVFQESGVDPGHLRGGRKCPRRGEQAGGRAGERPERAELVLRQQRVLRDPAGP